MDDLILNQDQASGVEKLLLELHNNERTFWESLTQPEKVFFLQVLDEIIKQGHSPKLDVLWEFDFIMRPPTIFEALNANFVDDIGQKNNYWFGPDTHQLFPFWKEEISLVCAPDSKIFEWCITGGIGGGKTTAAVFALIFKLIELSCLRNPHTYYELMSTSAIVYGLFNVSMDRAGSTAYQQMNGIINTSPYFREHFPIDKHRKWDDAAEGDWRYSIKLPKNIRITLGSKPNSAISQNVLGGLLDEVNFRELKTAKASGYTELEAFQLYNNVRRRIDSRFIQANRYVPALLCNVSSRQSTTDFLEEHIQRINKDACYCTVLPHTCEGKNVRITQVAVYNVRPKGTYSTQKFRVMLGDKITNHRILADDEPNPTGFEVVEVPMDFRGRFADDIDSSVRDICGIATFGTQAFLKDREALKNCISPTRMNPFGQKAVVLNQYDDITLEDLVNTNYLCKPYGEGYMPRFYPHAKRFIHLDLSLTGDATGIAMGCVSSVVQKKRQNEDGSTSVLPTPKIHYDFILRIEPPKNGQIPYYKIRQFIFTLKNIYNFPIKKITADTFQSYDMLQLFEKANIETEHISLDRGDKGMEYYIEARMAIMEGRIDVPEYPPFLSEILELYHDTKERKIDHRQGKSKDTSDAFAGVVVAINHEDDIFAILDTPPKNPSILIPGSTNTNKPSFVTVGQLYGDLITKIKDD